MGGPFAKERPFFRPIEAARLEEFFGIPARFPEESRIFDKVGRAQVAETCLPYANHFARSP